MLTGVSRWIGGPVTIAVLLAAVLTMSGCGAGSPAPGTYMGREIADVMSSEHGALWLDRPSRDDDELPARLLNALELNPSAHVADIGAGTGFFTFRLAEMVPHGRVYAVEVQSALVDTLNARAHRGGWRNVFPIQGTVDNPSLPDARIDLALIVSSYHEFSEPEAMMRRIFQAIRPGGSLVIVEYRKEDATIPIPDDHRMTAEQIRREMEAVGFTWRANREILPQQHVVVFQRH